MHQDRISIQVDLASAFHRTKGRPQGQALILARLLGYLFRGTPTDNTIPMEPPVKECSIYIVRSLDDSVRTSGLPLSLIVKSVESIRNRREPRIKIQEHHQLMQSCR